MVLTHYEKQVNSNWWKMMINNSREGGYVIWADKGHRYTIRDNKMFAPNMRAYKDMMANTTREFFSANIVKN